MKMQKSVIFAQTNLKILVRDHCHYTGEYRGAAHNMCNLKYNVPKNIPIVFHNGSNHGCMFLSFGQFGQMVECSFMN